jgi:hypothetical protein
MYQKVDLINISEDSLIVNIYTIHLGETTSCSLEGIAIRDTVGDFLNEEETVQDDYGEVFSVVNYRFLYKDSVYLLGIQLERGEINRLVYYPAESHYLFENSKCLL